MAAPERYFDVELTIAMTPLARSAEKAVRRAQEIAARQGFTVVEVLGVTEVSPRSPSGKQPQRQEDEQQRREDVPADVPVLDGQVVKERGVQLTERGDSHAGGDVDRDEDRPVEPHALAEDRD